MEKSKGKNINVGDTILIQSGSNKGSKGTVLVVRESSVIVELGKNRITGEPVKTVINHKNYKII